MQAGSSNWNKREENEMDRQGRMEMENKTLGTDICANIVTLYVNTRKVIIVKHSLSH
jgi:hypothetical protein